MANENTNININTKEQELHNEKMLQKKEKINELMSELSRYRAIKELKNTNQSEDGNKFDQNNYDNYEKKLNLNYSN